MPRPGDYRHAAKSARMVSRVLTARPSIRRTEPHELPPSVHPTLTAVSSPTSQHFQENRGCQDPSQAPRQDPRAVLPHRRRRLAHQARRSRDRGDRQVPPHREPSFIEVDSDRAQYWLGVGAQPTEQVRAILKLTGDWGKFKGDKDADSTVQAAEPKAAFVADGRRSRCLKPKTEKPAKAEEAPPRRRRAATDESGNCSPPRSNTSSRGSSITLTT